MIDHTIAPTPTLVRVGLVELVELFVRAVQRTHSRGQIGGAARRVALEIARDLIDRGAIALDAVRDTAHDGALRFTREAIAQRDVDLANALAELSSAGLLEVRYGDTETPLGVISLALVAPMPRSRCAEVLHVPAARAFDLLERRAVDAGWDDGADEVRARVRTKRGRFVELPAEVLGA